MDSLINALVARTKRASDEQAAEFARLRLINRLGAWEQRRSDLAKRQLLLSYERFVDASKYGALIRSAESVRSRDGMSGAPFVVANSMREVQPEINLLVSPNPEMLFYCEPSGAPGWESQSRGGDKA